jgi:D-alanine-D-alanine ligase
MGSLLKFHRPHVLEVDVWHLAEVDYILSQGRHSSTDRILDVGCGRGGRVRAFAAHGFGNVTGLDAIASNVEAAQNLARKKGLRADFVEGDPFHYPFVEQVFDEILILGDLFGHGSSPSSDTELLQEAYRALQPGGTLWLSVADGEWMRKHIEADSVEPIPNGFIARHRTLSCEGFRLTTRTIVANEERGIATDRILTEWLYGPSDLTDILYSLGFRAVSYRAHEPGFAATPRGAPNMPPRYLVRCRAPHPVANSALGVAAASGR